MLATRVIPLLLVKNTTLVKGEQFQSWRRVGSIMQAVRLYNQRGVDELIYLDISATAEDREPDYTQVREMADECFMPLTVGGGIRTAEHVRKLLEAGADKVAVNTAALQRPALITELATTFGSQCLVIAIDAKQKVFEAPTITIPYYSVYSHAGTRDAGMDPSKWASHAQLLGAGEILLTAIDLDGTLRGYDVELIRSVSRAVQVPVIAAGGAGTPQHCLEALQAGADAVACGAMYHFTEVTPLTVKRHLQAHGVPVRL